jgi:hypothetical protein
MDTRQPAIVRSEPDPRSQPDRRSGQRQPDPPCPRCQYEWIAITVRTLVAFQCQCQVCGEEWAVLKPQPSATRH